MQLSEKTTKILDLAVPATVENILQTLVGFIDTLMIARLGLIAVTAVGIAGNIMAIYLAVFIALAVGTSSLISRYLGAGSKKDARQIAIQSTGLSLLSGTLFGIVTVLLAPDLLGLLGADEAVVASALPYFKLVGGTCVLISLLTTFGSILRASGDPKTPMKVNAAVNVLNVVLDYILIFGLGPIPALGILGTAIGTVIARLAGVVLMYRKIRPGALGFSVRAVFQKTNYTELVRLSVPAALERLMMRLGQVIYFGLIVSMGVKTYAAHSIAGNLESFTYMPGMGLTTAASILVGKSFGAGRTREAYEYGVQAVKIGALIMSLGGLVMFFGSPWFAAWFTKDPEAIGKIVTALRIDAFAQVPLAAGLIFAGALQGLGDTKSPLYSTAAAGMWVVRVIGVYGLGIVLKMDIAGVWLAILLDLSLRAVFLTFRFRQKTMKAALPDLAVIPPK